MDGAIGSTGSNLSQAFPVVELLCFLVLILITVFRRKLSSNDQYRSESDSAPPSDLLNNSNVAHFFASVFNGKSVESTPSRLRLSNNGALCLERISLDDNILLNIVVYLSDSEIEKLTLTSKKFSENCTSDFIWEQLWIMSFGAMWNDPNLVKIREMRGITWNSIDQSQAITRSIDNHGERSSLHVKKCPRPPQGWFIFYKEFEFCWMDWLLAGCCTQGYCLIGLYGSLYDITNFLPDHPGSSESLTEAAGGDGTDIFSDIGHSSFASSLADMYLMWGAGEKKKIEQEKSVRAPFIQRQYAQIRPNKFQVHMKRDRYFAERLILRDNLIVRNTASFCRNRSRQTLLNQDMQGLEHENDRIIVESEIGRDGEEEVDHNPLATMALDNNATNDSIGTSIENLIITDHGHIPPLPPPLPLALPLPPLVTINNTNINDVWPLGINLNLDISSNISAGIDHITTSLSLPKSVLSLRESIYLANTKASNFLRRGTMRNRLRDRTAMKSMAPTLFTSHECRSGRKHSGKLRMFYDPVELQWWGWWTCCGMGELSVDTKEEEALCLQVSEQNISYKIC